MRRSNMFIRIEELAKKKGVSMAQISLAWCMAKEGVTAPIIGTTSLQNLEDLLGEYRRFCDRRDDEAYPWGDLL